MEDIKKKYPLLFEDKKKEINRMYEDSWNQARKIAKILKNKYGAETIIVFGSMTEKNRFHKRSDIDLAVEGIPDEKFYEAYGEITGKLSDFKVDLVDIKDCKKSLLSAIEKEGIKI